MKAYGQYCPIARASEILAERWTPIILRNILLGATRFNDIAEGAPGLSRALLTTRLRELERAGVLQIRPKPDGRGKLYEPTAAGRDAWSVLKALGHWGDQWTEVEDENANTGMILWLWCQNYVRRETLPGRRVTVRFDYPDRFGRTARDWLLVEHGEMQRCRFDPGFGDDVVVTVEDPVAFARWHLGLIEWSTVLRAGVRLSGSRELRRALPTWNTAPETHIHRRAAQRAAAPA